MKLALLAVLTVLSLSACSDNKPKVAESKPEVVESKPEVTESTPEVTESTPEAKSPSTEEIITEHKNFQSAKEIFYHLNKSGLKYLTLEIAFDFMNSAYNEGQYKKESFSGKTYETGYLIREKTIAGDFLIYDEKITGKKDRMIFSITSNSAKYNFNINKSDVLKRVKDLELGSPIVKTYSGGSSWTWKWNTNGFKCNLKYSFDNSSDGFGYSCEKQY